MKHVQYYANADGGTLGQFRQFVRDERSNIALVMGATVMVMAGLVAVGLEHRSEINGLMRFAPAHASTATVDIMAYDLTSARQIVGTEDSSWLRAELQSRTGSPF